MGGVESVVGMICVKRPFRVWRKKKKVEVIDGENCTWTYTVDCALSMETLILSVLIDVYVTKQGNRMTGK